jgi:lysophospholipase L1-like esterase
MRDGDYMDRFEREGLRRFTARQAVGSIAIAGLVLLLVFGAEIRTAGEEMNPGVSRTLVLAVGKPAGWLADQLPFAGVGNDLVSWLSPDGDLDGRKGFDENALAAGGGVPPVTPDAFDPAALGEHAAKRPLRRVLVTGDSLAQPLDAELARRLSRDGVKVDRDAHLGTGISKTIIVDWGKLSAQQAESKKPDAVVFFLGANEGFPMPGPGGRQVECCGPGWAAVYATRARQMMDNYRRGGAAKVYWLTLPAPRDPDRQDIARSVNAAIVAAAAPYRAQVRVLDTQPTFTPGGRYRDAIGGKIVRESDGIHLNEAGAQIEAGQVLTALDRDFTR